MERAIDSNNGQLVYWEQIYNDKYPEYMILDNKLFYADVTLLDEKTIPFDVDKNKIEVIYRKDALVKSKKTEEAFYRRGCFYFKNSELGICFKEESNLHKYLKGLAYKIRKEKSISLKALNVADANYEDIEVKSANTEIRMTNDFIDVRADVFVLFEKTHNLFGQGVIIEIQLSPQVEWLTKDRTLERGLFNMSCVWIKDESISTYELYMDNEVELKFLAIPPSHTWNEHMQRLQSKFTSFGNQSVELDMRLKNLKEEINSFEFQNAEVIRKYEKLEEFITNEWVDKTKSIIDEKFNAIVDASLVGKVVKNKFIYYFPEGSFYDNLQEDKRFVCSHCNTSPSFFEIKHSRYDEPKGSLNFPLRWVCSNCKKWNELIKLKRYDVDEGVK